MTLYICVLFIYWFNNVLHLINTWWFEPHYYRHYCIKRERIYIHIKISQELLTTYTSQFFNICHATVAPPYQVLSPILESFFSMSWPLVTPTAVSCGARWWRGRWCRWWPADSRRSWSSRPAPALRALEATIYILEYLKL